jgi:excisionase family DNA binding protein
VTQENQLLTVRQVAQILQVSKQTVRDWVNRGVLPASKLNSRVWRINEHDVKSLLTDGANQ